MVMWQGLHIIGPLVWDKRNIWIKHVCELLTKEEIDNNIMTTWSGYHSRMKPRAEIDILPLFPDKSFPAIFFKPWWRQVRNFDRMGSGWCLRLVCSPLAELYQRLLTTILSALGMIIKFHWWPSISFSKEHRPTYSHGVIQIYLKNDLTNSRGRDVCVSTVHLLSKWKLSFVVCALSEKWWFWVQCLGWIVSLVFSVWPHHFFQMVTESCEWLSDVVFCTFWYFRCSTVYL